MAMDRKKKLPPGPERDQAVCNVLSRLIGREVRPWTDDVSHFGAAGGFGPAVAPNLQFLPSRKTKKEYNNSLKIHEAILSAALSLRSWMKELSNEDIASLDDTIKLLEGPQFLKSERQPLLGIVTTLGIRDTLDLSNAIMALAVANKVEQLELEISAFVPKRPDGGAYPADLQAEQVVRRMAIWFRKATGELPAAAFHGVQPSNPFSRAVAEIHELLELPRPNARQVGRACDACAELFGVATRTIGAPRSP
ncbi:MAG: hypothetical protein ACE37J_04960 [Pikeienuella sp.]|uniref:hypothetical protein n=1 Tax=Pikeienuella sp. TaxID=2831957 RepID=UPI00391CAD2F